MLKKIWKKRADGIVQRYRVKTRSVEEEYNKMTGEQRVRIMFDLNRRAKKIMESKIRAQHPSWSDSQVIAQVEKQIDRQRYYEKELFLRHTYGQR